MYLDSNVYKFSATRLLRFRPQESIVDWGGQKQTFILHEPITVNPNEGITKNPDLRREADLLPQVAALAGAGLVEFLINIETQMEVWGLPNLDSETGGFYGAHRKIVEAPIRYGRVLFRAHGDYRAEQFNYLCSLRDKRFLELQRITGAYQGEDKVNRNQLLDAFHLWCAEHNGCNFLLSLDFKLAKVIGRSKTKPRVRVVRPSELLAALGDGTREGR